MGILRPIALFDRSVSVTGTGPPPNNCPTPGGFNGAGILVDLGNFNPPASATSVAYSLPLTAIGSPASFGWRIAEPAASTCQNQGSPEPNPRDVLPDSGLASFGGGPGGPGGEVAATARRRRA